MKNIKPARKIEYDGEHKDDSILIGNFGDVDFVAKGDFELSGMIYSKQTVTFTVLGKGLIKFHGVCHKLIIHLVKGDCVLDLNELESHEVSCVSLRDTSRTLIGPTRIINRANLQDEAILKYNGNPRILSYTISGSSRIEAVEIAGESKVA
jgi:hypothetical protein